MSALSLRATSDSARLCECGCRTPIPDASRPSRRFIDDKHRAAAWKARTNYGRPARGPRSGRNARSGAQVSYRKAVELLAVWFGYASDLSDDDARRRAEVILRGALSEKQAARLRERDG